MMANVHEPPGFSGVNTTVGVAAAVLTALGIGAGIAFRMLRNDPVMAGIFLALMVIGSAASLLTKNSWVWLGAYLLFFIGVFGLVWHAVEVSIATERPRIVTTAETMASGLVKVTTTIKAEGLLSREMIYFLARAGRRVAVNPATGEISGDSGRAGRAVIKEAAFGPNADGAIDASFVFEVSPALFWDVWVTATKTKAAAVDIAKNVLSDCIPKNEATTNYGCTRFILPNSPLRPSINVSYSLGSAGAADTLTANVAAGSVPPTHVILLSVWAGDQLVTSQTLGPDLAGAVKATAAISLTHERKSNLTLCAIAERVQKAAPPSLPSGPRPYCKRPESIGPMAAVAVVNTT